MRTLAPVAAGITLAFALVAAAPAQAVGPTLAPVDTSSYYTVVAKAWTGDSIAAAGWKRDKPIMAAAPGMEKWDRRSEYNPAKGRNIQIVLTAGTVPANSLVSDVDAAGKLVKLAGVKYADPTSANKAIAVTSRRHCTRSYKEALVAIGFAGANESAAGAKCAAGMITRYSSGRISSVTAKSLNGGFNFVTRVKLPEGAQRGTRMTVWTNNSRGDINTDRNGIVAAYCTAKVPLTRGLSEFDAFEWYGRWQKLTQTTHIGCNYAKVGGTIHAATKVGSGIGGWHTASVTFNGKTSVYAFDLDYDHPTMVAGPQGTVSSTRWVKGAVPTQAQWKDAVFSTDTAAKANGVTMNWQVIVNSEVFGAAPRNTAKTAKYFVDDKAVFRSQTMLVDYARSYQHA